MGSHSAEFSCPCLFTPCVLCLVTIFNWNGDRSTVVELCNIKCRETPLRTDRETGRRFVGKARNKPCFWREATETSSQQPVGHVGWLCVQCSILMQWVNCPYWCRLRPLAQRSLGMFGLRRENGSTVIWTVCPCSLVNSTPSDYIVDRKYPT